MGEKANKSGKIGEEKAKKLLKLIGWSDLLEGHEIQCNRSAHLNEKGNKKPTHGVDLLYVMNNPFHDNRTDVFIISAKHTINVYPKTDNARKKAFRSHLEDLQHTIECSKSDSEINSYIDSSSPKRNKEFIGILFWLQTDHEKATFQNMKEKLSNAEIDSDYKYPVYLIDNHLYGFVESVLSDINAKSTENNYQSYDFYAPSIVGSTTAISVNEDRIGKALTLELLASGIIIFKVCEKDNTPTLVIYSTSIFSEDSYRKLLAYGLRFSDSVYQRVEIGMLGYNETLHEKDVLKAQATFNARTEKCNVFAYQPHQMMAAYKLGEGK